MKKHKFLVAVLAIAIMLMGAGYAYWTQALTINNTVSTGYLDVKFVPPTIISDWDDGIYHCSDLVTCDSAIAPDGQSMSFTVGNFYPGAGASLNFLVKNTGTVNAKISNFTGVVTNNQALADALDYKVDSLKVYSTRHGWVTYEFPTVNADTVADLVSKLNASDWSRIVLEPNDILVLCCHAPGYEVLMPATITGSDFESQTTSFNIGINFTQFNL